MPSGQTHDSITLYSLPVVTAVSFWETRSGNLTLLIAGGFLFGGLMFGPDLDIYSRHYQRWGWFRFIWLPYQKSLRHRSFLSHGPIIGTILRILYITVFFVCVSIFFLFIAQLIWNIDLKWQNIADYFIQLIRRYAQEFLALFLGFELGAMSHSLSDWGGSAYKRYKKQGISGLLPRGKIKKRKVTSRGRPRDNSKKHRTLDK